MMKKRTFILLLILLTSACSRAASSTQPTEPALNFPTISPDNIALCTSADLATSANSNGTPESIAMGVTLTNQSKNICMLLNPPQISLFNADDKPIVLTTRDILAVQTPPAPAMIQLAPSQSVIISMIWQNYCQPVKTNDLIMHLNLAEDQHVEVKMKLQTMPGCQDQASLSLLSIAPYSIPP
jgi:hypothetical protein